MGFRHVISAQLQNLGGQLGVMFGPQPLLQHGCNFPVEVATPEIYVSNPASPAPRNSMVVMAHLDTGASQTMIAPTIAQQLALVQTGVTTHTTAGGMVSNPSYAVDITFVGTSLTPRPNLNVGSCALPFTLERHAANPNDPVNFGILIGRDIMAMWHIAWDGRTSNVMIYD